LRTAERRGENADQWYLDERRVSVEAGVNYVDFGLSSGDDLTDEQLDQLVTILRDAPHPVLVHCFAGADRSGLVSAAYQLVVGNLPPEEAAGQLLILVRAFSLVAKSYRGNGSELRASCRSDKELQTSRLTPRLLAPLCFISHSLS
jgi:protein tyrosine/serine phosphatase